MPPTSIEQSEIERERIYKAFVIDWVAKHPTTFLLFYLKRALCFWSPFLQEATFTQALFGVTFNAMLLVFAITCVVTDQRLWRKLLPIYVSLLTFTAGYSLAFIATRFRLPIYPLLEILAAGGMLVLLDKFSISYQRTERKIP
jgi:hypothetical protein